MDHGEARHDGATGQIPAGKGPFSGLRERARSRSNMIDAHAVLAEPIKIPLALMHPDLSHGHPRLELFEL
jgi:hypothetical protein